MIEIQEPELTFKINDQEIIVNPLELFDSIVAIESEHGIEKRNEKVKELLKVKCSSATIERVIESVIDFRADFIEQGKKKLSVSPE